MKRPLEGGYELDDDPSRIDLDAVHRYLSEHAYWSLGRSRETQERMNAAAARIVGLYQRDEQVGFARAALVGGMEVAYLYDVYVLAEHRGRGLGLELVREIVVNGPYGGYRWLLDTRDAQRLYEKIGFGAPSKRLMERPRAQMRDS
jgi:GNAT superfamily N-acetyltransferase